MPSSTLTEIIIHKKFYKMKRLFIFLTATALALGIGACQQIKDNINEATTTHITTDMVIPVKAIESSLQKGDITFQCEENYSIAENAELKEHLQSISDIDVIGIEIKIAEAAPENMILKQAHFFLHEPESNDVFTCSTPENFPIATNSVYSINESEANWKVINTIVDNLGDIHLTCNGTVSSEAENATLSLQVVIKVKATVSANL